MNHPTKPFRDEEGREWLNEMNYKKQLIQTAYGLKKQMNYLTWEKIVGMYDMGEIITFSEAGRQYTRKIVGGFLNALNIENLESLIKDLEKAAKA